MNRLEKFCIIMVLLIIVPFLFFACDSSSEMNSTQKNTDASKEVISEQQPTTLITDELTDQDYGGRVFNFITGSEVHWGLLDRICVESETGEVINDATFRRTLKVEERFNIKIEDIKIPYHRIGGDLKKSVNAGDKPYDAVYMWGLYFLDLAAEGFLYDLNKLPNVNFSKPYWDQNAKNQLSIGNRLYMMTGDANMFYNDATWVTMFNKDLIRDHNLEDPYQLVRDGKWTINPYFK